MKQICWIVFTSLSFILTGCETENKKYYAGDFINPEVKTPENGNDFILTEATANDSLTVAWTTAEFGFPCRHPLHRSDSQSRYLFRIGR